MYLCNMAKKLTIKIKESEKQLKELLRSKPIHLHNRIRMLQLIKKGKIQSKDALAEVLSVSNHSIHRWRTHYRQGGTVALFEDKRGGYKKAAINGAVYRAVEKRLSSPRDAFRSFVELQQWLEEQWGVRMQYQALWKFVGTRFGAKLKVARKSHIHKSEVLVEDFKKNRRAAKTY